MGPGGGGPSSSRAPGSGTGGSAAPSASAPAARAVPSQPTTGGGAQGAAAPAAAAVGAGYGDGEGAVGKRRLEEGEEDVGAGASAKKAHVEEEQVPEPSCHLCAQLVRQGRAKVRGRGWLVFWGCFLWAQPGACSGLCVEGLTAQAAPCLHSSRCRHSMRTAHWPAPSLLAMLHTDKRTHTPTAALYCDPENSLMSRCLSCAPGVECD